MATACSCRTNALRLFVRSVAQVHLPNENLARTPWHETRRQAQRHTTTRWPAVASLHYRAMHTAAEPGSPAQDGDAQSPSAEAQEQRPSQGADSPEAESAPQLEGPQEQSKPQDTATGDDVLSQIPKRSGNAKKGLVYAKLEASQTKDNHAAPQSDTQTEPFQEIRQFEDQIFDIPEQAGFSVAEEIRVEEGRREKQRGEREREKERARRERERKRERERREREERRMKNQPMWAIQREALKKKFPDGWKPFKRLSPDALNGVRALHHQFPDMFTTTVLAQRFEVSPEAIRRILRTKWEPSAEEDEDRQRRWYNRGLEIWEKYAALGRKPPKKWRDAGVSNEAWEGLTPWDKEEQEQERQREREREPRSRQEGLGEEIDEAEMEKKRRLKTQRRLAKNLM